MTLRQELAKEIYIRRVAGSGGSRLNERECEGIAIESLMAANVFFDVLEHSNNSHHTVPASNVRDSSK